MYTYSNANEATLGYNSWLTPGAQSMVVEWLHLWHRSTHALILQVLSGTKWNFYPTLASTLLFSVLKLSGNSTIMLMWYTLIHRWFWAQLTLDNEKKQAKFPLVCFDWLNEWLSNWLTGLFLVDRLTDWLTDTWLAILKLDWVFFSTKIWHPRLRCIFRKYVDYHRRADHSIWLIIT